MMKRVVFVSVLVLFLASASRAQIVQPVNWTFKAQKVDEKQVDLIFEAQIDPGWHLYGLDIPTDVIGPLPTVVTLESSDNFKVVDSLREDPVPKKEWDALFEIELGFHSIQAKFIQRIEPLTDEPFTVVGIIEGQVCDDSNCSLVDSDFEIKVNTQKKVAKTESQSNAPPKNTKKKSSSDQDITSPVDLSSRSLWSLFFVAFGFGLIALLTPCVFPMIPMTVSFFMHGEKSRRRSLFEGIFFGGSIVLIFTVIGTIVAIVFGPGIGNFLSTHWIPNVLFFLIFIFFAAWFFGLFEFTLPNWMITKSDQQADKGGFLGPFFLAFTTVLVSFSCTGPIVGTLLVQSAGGEILEPIIGMLGFSIAFALPFTLFALFPSWLNSMPKSGGWLNSVKVVLGFIELALGLKFLSVADQTYHWGILDREVYLALWIVIFTLMGFYLLGKIRFKHDSEIKYVGVFRLFLVIATFSFVVYLIPGMVGAPLKALSGYLPPMHTHDFDLHKIIRESSGPGGGTANYENQELCDKPKYSDQLELPWGLEGYFDYDQGLACAKELNKPVFIDFTGHGCVNCREMEARVWSDPRVLRILKEDYVIIALYVDDKKIKLDESEWVTSTYDGRVKKTLGKKNADFQITRFAANIQPLYCLLDTDGELLVPTRDYNLDIEDFISFLESGIEEFNKQSQ
jgi:thiol:disulfide interchange protein DsbD